jgi:O-antigen/teichoic acid export membrane protein
MTLAGNAARGAALTYGAQAVRVLVQVGSIVVLARLLTPSAYGTVTMVLSVVGIATVFGDLGLSMAAMQAQSLSDQQRSNLLWINAGLGLLLGGAVFLAAPLVADFYGRPELQQVCAVLSVIFFLYALTPQLRAELASRLRFKILAAADVVAQVVGFGTAVLLALLNFGYWALVANQIVVAAVTVLVVAVGARWRPLLPRRVDGMRPLLVYGVQTLGVQLLTYISGNIDNVLIGRFLGSSSLGLYSRASQLFRLPLQQVATPLTPVALPVLSRLKDDLRNFEAFAVRAQLILSYLLGGVLFVFVCAAAPIVSIALGRQWGAAVPLLQILAVGGAFQAFGYVFYWVFLARGYTGLQLKWSLAGRSVMVLLLFAGIHWGMLGVAVAATIGQFLLWLVMGLFALPKTGVQVGALIGASVRPAVVYTVAAIVAVAFSPLLLGLPALLVLAIIGVEMVAVLAFAALLIPRVRQDVEEILNTVRRLRRS